ncbi:hypothetical protein HA052_05015 [Chromobacterium haemolyticum]|uniref:Uncharacterized protein n=1 Tax=Chromobacterium fluminis TaxID=3044269 RepID=A0ABX0KYC3_9NEIS|nr:hypothetical protein [Chromobacterium haemolyticum]NHR04552.1 hypothetical protein [Chromobacterium haemolyticum]
MKSVRFNLASVALAILTGVTSVAASAATTVATQQNRTVVFNESVGLDGIAQVKGRIGVVGTTGNTITDSLLGQNVTNAASVFSVQPISLSSASLSTVEIQSLAQSWFANRISALSNQVVAHLNSVGADSAWLDYQQTVKSKGKTKYIVFSVSILKSGKMTWSGVNVVDSAPTTVYTVYTNKTVAAGLPQNWQYPDAGTLKYDTRNLNFLVVTPQTVIQTNGAYDEPASGVSAITDPDAGLKCLIDSQSSPNCPTAFPDVKKLIKTTDSIRTVVDYVRKVQPDYTQQPDGTQAAKMAIDIYERTIQLPACCCQDTGQTYINRQRYGFSLITIIDRYLVNADGSYVLVNRYSGHSVSPTIDQTKSVAITRAQFGLLPGQIINPEDGKMDLVDVSTYPLGMIVNLAPITYR